VLTCDKNAFAAGALPSAPDPDPGGGAHSTPPDPLVVLGKSGEGKRRAKIKERREKRREGEKKREGEVGEERERKEKEMKKEGGECMGIWASHIVVKQQFFYIYFK